MVTGSKSEESVESTNDKGKAAVAIITCGILRDELEAIARNCNLTYSTLYLSPAPCINYDNIEKQLKVLLARAATIADNSLVVIGRCHPDIDEILQPYAAVRLAMNNCFEALLGTARMKELLEETNTFFTTPQWLKHWRRALGQGMKWDEVDARQNFGLYERILVLDAGVTPYTDEEVLELFDYTQVPVEVLPVDLSNLANLILAQLPA